MLNVCRSTFRFSWRSGVSGVVSGCVVASAWVDIFHVFIQLKSSEILFSNLQNTKDMHTMYTLLCVCGRVVRFILSVYGPTLTFLWLLHPSPPDVSLGEQVGPGPDRQLKWPNPRQLYPRRPVLPPESSQHPSQLPLAVRSELKY